MSEQVVIVTGANGGLGLAIARTFLHARDGHRVCLAVHTRRENAVKLAAEFPQACSLIELEATEPNSWKSLVQKVLEELGHIDVLVNNAGKHQDMLLGTMPAKVWSEVIAANLESAFHGCQAVLPAMIAQRSGRIVNMSSLSALLAPAGQANYAAAKAGLVAMTQSLAKEVARMNITVNAICPGYIETEALKSMPEEEARAARMRVPMRRFGRPEEVAAAVKFLASEEASYITGAVLKIDGGIF